MTHYLRLIGYQRTYQVPVNMIFYKNFIYLLCLEISDNLTPPFHFKLTPLFQRKLTPWFQSKLTPCFMIV